jgi:N-ethylmaleimide reductase
MSNLQILSKFTVGGQELQNRVVLAPLTRARCTPTEDPLDTVSRTPNDLMATYYEQRASAGLIITEATAVSEEGYGWLNSPELRTEAQMEAWKNIVDKVHAKGSKIYVQFWNMGRQAHSSFHVESQRVVSASDIPMADSFKVKSSTFEDVPPETPVPLTVDEIQSVVADYVHGAKLACQAGFDGIEIHSANGYLIDQFLQSKTNKRADQYGGSMENRFRFLKEIVQGVVDSGAYPSNRIGFRISPNGVFGDMGSEDNAQMFTFVAAEMSKLKVAYLHLMDGLGFGYHGLCPAVTAADIRKVFDGPIICNVGLTKEIAEGMIRSGAADLACFGRLYISNPDLVERFANDWPLEPEAAYQHWWQHVGAKGYTDWPTYKPSEEDSDDAQNDE